MVTNWVTKNPYASAVKITGSPTMLLRPVIIITTAAERDVIVSRRPPPPHNAGGSSQQFIYIHTVSLSATVRPSIYPSVCLSNGLAVSLISNHIEYNMVTVS